MHLRTLLITALLLIGIQSRAASTWRVLADSRPNNAVWMASTTTGWAVGEVGLINHTTDGGATWTPQSSGTTENLNGVWGVDASNVWAVGNAGTILHWDGSTWSKQTSSTAKDLLAIHGVNATNAWAVGPTKTIVYWNGTTWAAQAAPPGGGSYDLQGVFAADATNVWAVGTGGNILKGNGSTWTAQTNSSTLDLYAVWASSTTSVIAVGASGVVRASTTGGTTWAAGPTSGFGTATVRGISGADATHVWITGDGGVIRFYNGSGNFTNQTSNTSQVLNGIFAAATNKVVAVGARTTFDVSNNGTAWSSQAATTPAVNVNAIWSADDNDVWFVGGGGTVMHYNGTTFNFPSSGVSQVLNDVWGTDASNIWAVGANGTIIKWNGSAWASQTSGTTNALSGIHGTSTSDVWAVGVGGTILHYNGTAWSTQTSPVTANLNAVWTSSAGVAWVVGANGTIIHLASGTWKAQTSGTTGALTEVAGTSAASIFAVGASGTVLKYNGTAWAAQSSGGTTALSALSVINGTTQWTGGSTTILKGNGTTWAADGSTGFPYAINAIHGTSASTVFISTANPGMIFVNSPATVPEISIEQPAGFPLASGKDTINFGTVIYPSSVTNTFTIKSTGTANLTGFPIAKSGTGAASYSVTAVSSTTLATGTSTTFDVTFTPTADGQRTATLTVGSNDLDEPSFSIGLTGLGLVPVSITTQPVSKSVNPNGSVTLSCAVNSNASKTVSYQWQLFEPLMMVWNNITGATAASYTIAKAQESNQGDYRVTVTNPANSVVSNQVTLTVNDPVAITTAPVSKTVGTNSSVSLNVVATGTALKYQWRRNGTNIPGATADTYTINSAQLSNGGNYTVVVSNPVNSIITPTAADPVATLTVLDSTTKTLILPTLGKAVMTASYTGKTPTFSWQKDSNPITNIRATFPKNVLTITTLQVTAPSDSGLYTCTMTSPDGGAPVISSFNLIVFSDKPLIEGVEPLTMPTARVGDPTYSYQIPYSSLDPMVDPLKLQMPTSFSVSGLPTGLKYSSTTGLITGKPAVAITTDRTYPVVLTASNAKGKFSIKANLLVKALPEAAIGSFAGPIERSPTLNNNLGGRFDMTVTSTGYYSGKVILGGVTSSISGYLVSDVTDANPPYGAAIIKRTPANLTVSFVMDLSNQGLKTCDITDNTNHVAFTAWRKRWGTVMLANEKAALDHLIGYYTFGMEPPVPIVPGTMPPTSPSELIPQGIGYGYFTVASTGSLVVTCRLADGSAAFTSSSFCGPHGEVLVYKALYSNLGSVLGTLMAAEGTAGFEPAYGDNPLTGTVNWLRPAILTSTNHYYRSGVGPLDLDAVGGRYVGPKSPDLLFGVTDDGSTLNSHLTFTDGGISGTSTDALGTLYSPNVDVRIKAGGYVAVPAHSTTIVPDPNPRSTTLNTIATSTGIFSGKSTLVDQNPALVGYNVTRPLSYYGIVYRTGGVMKGQGFFSLARRPNTTTETVTTTDQLSGKVQLLRY